MSFFLAGHSTSGQQGVFNATTETNDNLLSLSGEWFFKWGEWIPTDDIASGNHDARLITLPSYLTDLDIKESTTKHNSGIMTYFIQIQNLPDQFLRPTIWADGIGEAWQAWWITDNGDSFFLGQSGLIAKRAGQQEFNNKNYLLSLPNFSREGYLVFYLSAHHSARSGLFKEISILEYTHANKSLLADLTSRALIIGVGFFIVVQNFTFFLKRRKDKTLLLLAIFALTGLLRSAFASRYVDFFANIDNFQNFVLRLEYLLVVWPAIAGLHMLIAYFPFPKWRHLPTIGYAYLLVLIVFTANVSLTTMTSALPLYQYSLAFFAIACLAVIVRGIVLRLKNSFAFLCSFIPLALAVINDVYASRSPDYSLFVAEYAFFLFLFIHTQLQATRFMTALDTSEHLTANLQKEVAQQTLELQNRNEELKERAASISKKHQEVKLLSETDHLTGLLNRQSLDSQFESRFLLAKENNQPLSLVMMDLDFFKKINDEHGHTVGDECLIFAASYLRGLNLRKRDLIARFGGEEFVLLLSDTDINTAVEVVQDIRRGLAKNPITGDHTDIHLQASFGIAELFNSTADCPATLFEHADTALYLAKQNGRNRVEMYDPHYLDDTI